MLCVSKEEHLKQVKGQPMTIKPTLEYFAMCEDGVCVVYKTPSRKIETYLIGHCHDNVKVCMLDSVAAKD